MYSKKIWKKGHVGCSFFICFKVFYVYILCLFVSFACIDHIQSLLVKAFS